MKLNPPKGKKWGNESEYTKMLREKQLQKVIDTRCAVCNVGVHRTAKGGMEWFKRHALTPRHKRNLRRRQA